MQNCFVSKRNRIIEFFKKIGETKTTERTVKAPWKALFTLSMENYGKHKAEAHKHWKWRLMHNRCRSMIKSPHFKSENSLNRVWTLSFLHVYLCWRIVNNSSRGQTKTMPWNPQRTSSSYHCSIRQIKKSFYTADWSGCVLLYEKKKKIMTVR